MKKFFYSVLTAILSLSAHAAYTSNGPVGQITGNLTPHVLTPFYVTTTNGVITTPGFWSSNLPTLLALGINVGPVTNYVTPEMFGATGGTHDDTLAFSNMLAYGKPIISGATNYTVSNSLVIPDGTFWQARGTVLNANPAMTNFVVNAGSATNFYIEGLLLNGTNYTNPNTRTFGTRHGFLINPLASMGHIVNCAANGFDGYGGLITGTDTGTGGHEVPLVEIIGFRGSFNYQGLVTLTLSGGSRGEYIDLVDCQLQTNAIGASIDAGNTSITGGKITDNGVNVQLVTGTPNGYHGNAVGTLINHAIGKGVSITGAATGYQFTSCNFLGGNSSIICITNSRGVVFSACQFDIGGSFTSTGGTGGYNRIENSTYSGTASQWTINNDGHLSIFNWKSRDTLGDAFPNTLDSNLTVNATLIANYVVSSNRTFYPPEMFVSADFGDTLDYHNTESPMNYEASVKLTTNTSVGSVAIPIPNWATNVISKQTYQWNGVTTGLLAFTNDFQFIYYSTNGGGSRSGGAVQTPTLTIGTNFTDVFVTNACPDTNMIKTLRMLSGNHGSLTNVTAPLRLIKWQVTYQGVPDVTRQ